MALFFRGCVERLSPVQGALIFSIICVIVSVTVCYLAYWIWEPISFTQSTAILLPIFIPVLLTPPIVYYFLVFGRDLASERSELLHRALQLKKEIERREQSEVALKELTTRDELTGLYNRRHFMEIANHAFRAARRFRTPLSFAFLDADHFKAVNDTHGHGVGDAALRHIAQICTRTLRESDVLARYGGEEFVILLERADRREAYEIAELLRTEIAAEPLVVGDRVLSLTVSIGVATISNRDTEITGPLRRADAALYEAKGGGRNRVCLSTADKALMQQS